MERDFVPDPYVLCREEGRFSFAMSVLRKSGVQGTEKKIFSTAAQFLQISQYQRMICTHSEMRQPPLSLIEVWAY
jgi:hypothetical protein